MYTAHKYIVYRDLIRGRSGRQPIEVGRLLGEVYGDKSTHCFATSLKPKVSE